jgi:hypothetical protein
MATNTKRKPREQGNPEPKPQSQRRASSAVVLREEEEDRRDIEDARKALAEAERDGYISWESLRQELGL